jgi:hypothetical protein
MRQRVVVLDRNKDRDWIRKLVALEGIMNSTELYWKIYCAALEGSFDQHSSDYAPGIAKRIREVTLAILKMHHIEPPTFPSPLDVSRIGPYNSPMVGHDPVWVGTNEWLREHEQQVRGTTDDFTQAPQADCDKEDEEASGQ